MKYKRNYKGLLGLWINEGKLYIDLVEHVEDKNEALVLGRMNEEIAIWDCKNNVEVKV